MKTRGKNPMTVIFFKQQRLVFDARSHRGLSPRKYKTVQRFNPYQILNIEL
jgi:hypothetical protein